MEGANARQRTKRERRKEEIWRYFAMNVRRGYK